MNDFLVIFIIQPENNVDNSLRPLVYTNKNFRSKRSDGVEQLRFPVTKKEAEKAGVSYSSEANKNALFPSRLRELREKKGVSQAALALALGVSKSTIGLYETGDTLPDIKTADEMASYFGVSTDYLVGRTAVRSQDLNIQQVCAFTGLSEAALRWIEDMRNEPNSEGLQALDRMLATEQFRDVVSYIVYMSKIFDEIKYGGIWAHLNENEQSIVQKAKAILVERDEYEVYYPDLNSKVEASKALLQQIFIDMVVDLFLSEKERGKFELETPVGEKSTFVLKDGL